MKALTLWEPWATLVAEDVKTIETRSWGTNYRGPLAIHSAQQRPLASPRFASAGDRPCAGDKFGTWELVQAHGDWFIQRRNGLGVAAERRLKFGHVLAIVDLVDCVQMTEETTTGRIGVSSFEIDPQGGLVYTDRDRNMSQYRDQKPLGWFEPGRYAWMFANVRPISPVPAAGKQQLWNWDPDR